MQILVECFLFLVKLLKDFRKRNNKIVLLARSKLDSIGNIMSKALKENGTTHEDFNLTMNGEKNITN